MGLVAWLRTAVFGGSNPGARPTNAPASASGKPKPAATTRNASVRDDWLTIRQPEFFGRAHRSANKRLTVGCNDSDGLGRGGYRESGNGRVVLVDHQTDFLVHELKCFKRPMDAAVSNLGSYIVAEGGFGSALQGDLVAVGLDGRERYRRRYRANIFNVGFSECGRFAAVQTANAPHADGNLLEVLDLELSCALFSRQPATGWADGYKFHVDGDGSMKSLTVVHKALGVFAYSEAGEFQDGEALQEARLEKGDYASRLMAARDLIKIAPSKENARKVLRIAVLTLNEGAAATHDWGSIAHRLRGECFELLGQLPEALDAFDRALSMDPKVGVTKRADLLRKRLATGRQ